jgi:RimJ/RimL family protein N-acetyltransferase
MKFQEESGNNPYTVCPTYESGHYFLRLVSMDDADDLFRVYNDAAAHVLMNDDNCQYGYSEVDKLDYMRHNIRLWLEAYRGKGFVRWSILDKQQGKAIGTIEMFGGNFGILRIDLRSDYEHTTQIDEILKLIIPEFFTLFDCPLIATKAVPAAKERIAALKKHGFILSDKPFTGDDGTSYGDYWILERKNLNG